jgi:glucosylceramidase
VTVQNEPEFPAPWEACSYDPESQGAFIANHLGPALAESHPNTKILIFDHNKDHIVNWARRLLSPENPASQYVSGTAYHWYAGGMDRLLDGAQGAPNMHRIISELDAMNVDQGGHVLINTEACHCPTTGYAGGDLNIAWSRASRNAHTILADLAAGSNGFIEWNLM